MVKFKTLLNQQKLHSSPTNNSGATMILLIEDSFMYIETSGNKSGSDDVCRYQRADIFQPSNFSFYYIKFSILTNVCPNSKGRFRIQHLLADNTWSTRYNILKNDRYSNSSTHGTLVSFHLNIKNHGKKLNHNQLFTSHADIRFSNVSTKHAL